MSVVDDKEPEVVREIFDADPQEYLDLFMRVALPALFKELHLSVSLMRKSNSHTTFAHLLFVLRYTLGQINRAERSRNGRVSVSPVLGYRKISLVKHDLMMRDQLLGFLKNYFV